MLRKRVLHGDILEYLTGILQLAQEAGSDAYDFAKGKPITLLSGANLVHLLAKHGHHAKIDIREARQILSEKEKQK